MIFKKIDKTNFREAIALKVDESQKWFVASNVRSLAEAAYDDGLNTLGIYDGDKMVGFLLYDYDEDFPGWSLSRFMIGKQFQGKGYGKKAVLEFLEYFKEHVDANKIFISVSLENKIARKMYSDIGFRELHEVQYESDGVTFHEMQMVKELY